MDLHLYSRSSKNAINEDSLRSNFSNCDDNEKRPETPEDSLGLFSGFLHRANETGRWLEDCLRNTV